MAESGRRRGETTREVILTAAEAVFAQHGFDGARVDTIANVSGYNKNLIFRYFGDKLGLYTQVLKRADREMGELLARVFASGLSSESTALQPHQFRAFLTTMLQTLFDYLLEHPRLVRMLTWEMAEGWQTLAQIASQFPPEDTAQFEPFFHQARGAGLLRSDFVPMIQFTMIVPICQAYLVYLPLYQRILPDEDLSSARGLAHAREYLVDFVVSGLMSSLPETKPEKES